MENNVAFAPGQTIFMEGDQTTDMFIIMSGTVAIYNETDQDNRVLLAELGPGSMIGEMSLISGRPRSATAIAKERVEAKVVTRAAFGKSVSGVPSWAIGIAKALIERLRRINIIIKKNAKVESLEQNDSIVFIEDFTIQYDEKNAPHIAYLKGYFFASDIPTLDDFVKSLFQKRVNHIEFDFSDVIDMDQTSYQYILKIAREMLNRKIKFLVHNVQLIHANFESDEDLKEVISKISPPRVNVSVGEYLIKQDQESNNLYIIKSGRFEIVREVDGKRVKVAEIGAGNVIGEMALIAGGKRSASVRALKPSIIYVISPVDIHTNKFNIPQWFLRIIQQLISRISNSNAILDKIVKHEKLNQQLLGIELDYMPDKSRTGRFRLRGEMLSKNRTLLKRQLVKLINNGFTKIILDFSLIQDMDSSFMSVFNLISASLSARGGKLLFINTTKQVDEILKTGLIYKEGDIVQEEEEFESEEL